MLFAEGKHREETFAKLFNYVFSTHDDGGTVARVLASWEDACAPQLDVQRLYDNDVYHSLYDVHHLVVNYSKYQPQPLKVI